MLPSPTAVTVAVRIVPLHTMYPAVAWVALQTEIRISVLLQRQTKAQFGRQGSGHAEYPRQDPEHYPQRLVTGDNARLTNCLIKCRNYLILTRTFLSDMSPGNMCHGGTNYLTEKYMGPTVSLGNVFVNGVIYFHAYGVRSNIVISFDLKSEKFGEVCLLERLVHALDLEVTKVNELLGLLEYYDEGDHMRVLGTMVKFLIEPDVDNYRESRIEVYEPLSGQTNDVGIIGKLRSFFARSYMETLLLLNESDAIIH
ncbi:zinc finger, CCHC-type containing protein [Tanacetum coccineum]